MTDLGVQDGRPIIGTGVKVRKTGDGLSETVEVDPELARSIVQGDEGFIVFEYRCVDVQFPVEDRREPAHGGLRRVVVLDAGTATFIDGEIIAQAVEAQREKNLRWRAEQKGQHQLDDQALMAAHEAGDHDETLDPHCPVCRFVVEHDNGDHADGLRPGCPFCNREVELAAAEADGGNVVPIAG